MESTKKEPVMKRIAIVLGIATAFFVAPSVANAGNVAQVRSQVVEPQLVQSQLARSQLGRAQAGREPPARPPRACPVAAGRVPAAAVAAGRVARGQVAAGERTPALPASGPASLTSVFRRSI